MRATTLFCSSAALILPMMVAPGFAHAEQSPAPASTGSSNTLSEIIVTAQKRAENLQSVPIAISAQTGAQLAAKGVTDTTQLNAVSPGVNIRADAGAFQPAIRGIGTSSTVVENPVALYIDGIYYPQQREGFQNLEDIAQIAVLKGPQGTLFGRNATAGVIQITTAAPAHDPSALVHADLDSYGTLKIGAYATGGLSQTIAGSVAVAYATQADGWGRDITNGHDTFRTLHDFSIRGKLRFEPTSETDMTLVVDYADRKRLENSRQPYAGLPLAFPGTGPLKSVYDTYGGIDAYNALTGGGASLTVNHELPFARLVSITSYRDVHGDYQFDNSSVAQPYFTVRSPDSPSRDFTQELQLISPAEGKFSWAAGAFYFNYSNGADPIIRQFSGIFTPLPTSAVMTTTRAIEKTESVAPFGEIKWRLMPDTHLTLGARYTYEKRHLEDASVAALNGLGVTTTTAPNPHPLAAKVPTYRIAIDHRFSDTVMGYLSFNTGFKSGGFNTVSPATAGYLPEKLKAYEVGLKSELFDSRLRLNAAAFDYDYTNLQVIQFIGLTQAVVNGPSAQLYGLDVDFDAQIAPGLRASGGFELAHATFTSYNNAVVSAPKPGGGATIFPGDATGNRLPLAQRGSATLALDYHRSAPRGAVDLNLTANFNGDYYFTPDNLLRQGPYTIINASAKLTLPGDRVSFSVWARNLADAKIISQVTEQTLGYPAIYGSAPRTFGVSGATRF